MINMKNQRLKLEDLKTEKGKEWILKNPEKKIKVFSGEWNMYWSQGRIAYTANPEQAGIFILKEAFEWSKHYTDENKMQFEFIDGI